MSVWILLFLCMMTMPLAAAVFHCSLKKGKILEIRQDYVRNARYFGKRFAELIEKALPDMKDGVITLSRKEEVQESREGQTFPEKDVEKLIIARETVFCPKESGLPFTRKSTVRRMRCLYRRICTCARFTVRKGFFSETGYASFAGQTQKKRLSSMTAASWEEEYPVEISL